MVSGVDFARWLRHLCTPAWAGRRVFPVRVLDAIETAIGRGEATHRGQIRFVVEAALTPRHLFHGLTARGRALQVFSELRVWDTEHNNGVLIYLLLADRRVEIVADRGIHALAREHWQPICQAMEAAFRAGRFQQGVIEGVEALADQLEGHFPGDGPMPNELPDRPVLI